jgi:hypothetical protein
MVRAISPLNVSLAHLLLVKKIVFYARSKFIVLSERINCTSSKNIASQYAGHIICTSNIYGAFLITSPLYKKIASPKYSIHIYKFIIP